MKSRFIFSLLLITALLVTPVTGEGATVPSIVRMLDGRQVLVRVYNNWQENPAEFEEVHAQLDGSTIVLDPNDIADGAFFVMVDKDQDDEIVRKYMAPNIYAESCRERLQFKLSIKDLSFYALTLMSGVGNPLSGAKVKIFLYGKDLGKASRILLGEVELGESGDFRTPYIYGSFNRVYLVVSHPDNHGTVAVDPEKLDWYTVSSSNIKTVLIPWASEGTEAYDRSLCGVVVDDANNPIGGASIKCEAICLPDGAEIDVGGTVFADEKGCFDLYPIIRTETPRIMGKLTRLIPPKSKYKVRIEAPKEIGLAPFVGSVISDTNCPTVKMPDYGYFRTFVFEDEGGPITDPKSLSSVNVEIERKDKSALKYRYAHLRKGVFLPLGTYKAYLKSHGQRYEFGPLEVTEDSPEELVFRLARTIAYCGRVVHGITGEPMQGAFVIEPGAPNFMGGTNLSEIGPEQWKMMHQLPINPSLNDPNLKVLRKDTCFKELMRAGYDFDEAMRLSATAINMDRIVRTDEKGRFRIRCEPGIEIYRLIAFEEDFLGVSQYTRGLKANPDGRVQVPTIALFPAAKVTAELSMAVDWSSQPGISPRWIIDADNLPEWAGRPQDIEPYESIYNLDGRSVDWRNKDANEISDLESEFPAREYNPYLGFFYYMLFDFLMKDRFSFFGIPVTIHRDYNYTSAAESVEADPGRTTVWVDEGFEDPKDDPNRVPTFCETYESFYGFTYDRIVSVNRVQPFHVPAGLNVQLRFDVVTGDSDIPWGPVIIPEMINLKQGETLDLGRWEFEPTVNFLVKVVDSAGNPVEGVPVKNWFKGVGRTWARKTDEKGRAQFDVPPHTKGTFYLALRGHGRKSKEATSYEIRGQEDNGREFTLTLSDDMLRRLFRGKARMEGQKVKGKAEKRIKK